ncbi:alpha/beta hydrolase family protein [Thalassobellus citreus]|uniref:alpha/beta hydrolase family protein n=1 Tax=Thalassobellus citreus TaxID=3367752 RepID=UPI0037B60A41
MTTSRFQIVCLGYILLFLSLNSCASTGKWLSITTENNINYTATESKSPKKDFTGNNITIVYLKNLGFEKIGQNTNREDVAWLLSQGYRVIELDYNHDKKASATNINKDIIAINKAISNKLFCNFTNCSLNKSYILFEGYRISRDVPYFIDNPKVYNTPKEYVEGDELRMDIIYPANPKVKPPTILSFSYSNSYATYDSDKEKLTDAHKDLRLFLPYTFAGFNDSFLEGLPAHGMAWAIADHPKYCPWGSGKPVNGKNDTYKSYQTNPDAAQKVKSAIRTLRKMSDELGVSGNIGVYGFSRGSTAGSLAIGDKSVSEFENTGFNIGISDAIQAAALGPGVFDYTKIYNASDDGDSNLETRCEWAWGNLEDNFELWNTMGASYLVESSATAPTLFFHNKDDAPYYQDQFIHLKAKLDSLKVPTSTLINYGTGHSVPQTSKDLNTLYSFFKEYLNPPSLKIK